MRDRQRTVRYAGLALLLIAVLAWRWGGAGGTERTADPAAGDRGSPGTSVAATGGEDVPPAPGGTGTGGSTSGRRRAVGMPSLGNAAAAEYRRRARYPRSASPLAEGPDPLLAEREVTPIRQRGPQGEDPTLTVFPEAVGYEAPDVAVVHAMLTVNDRRVWAREVRGVLLTEDLTPVGDLMFRDDGAGGDAEAGDGVYTAVAAPDADADLLAQSYLVQVVAWGAGDVERRAATSFLYSRPDAQLTGRYRDVVVDGNLLVGAEVAVRREGRFHVEATLYAADGTTPLARAQTAAVLGPGSQWMELPFYGLILRERGMSGPYVLRWVALSTTTQMPNAKNRLVDAGYRTGAHPVTAFTERPFDDPDLLEAAARLERDGGALAGGGDG